MKLEAKQRLHSSLMVDAVWKGHLVTCADGSQYESLSPVTGEPVGIRGTRKVNVNKNTFEAFDHQGMAARLRVVANSSTGVGGGVLFIAKDTKRVLFLLRSATSEAPGTWCCPGGGIEPNETVEEGIHRECREEIGYDKPIDLQLMHSDHQDNFVFHNYFAYVPNEFDPVLNDEHDDFMWADYFPDPVHPGLMRSIESYRGNK
jgi:8-oxo-dGTP pyrophosphatase MutT (NUDIX family)